MAIVIESSDAMQTFAHNLAQQWHRHVLLYGDLWAGKTHFCKWFAQGLGIQQEVTSPTYAYSNIYDNKLLHGDFYRLEDKSELFSKWLIDSIEEFPCVLIERPRWSEEYAEDSWLVVEISITSPSTRSVTVSTFSDYTKRMENTYKTV